MSQEHQLPTPMQLRPVKYWQGSNGTMVLSTSVQLPDFPDESFHVADLEVVKGTLEPGSDPVSHAAMLDGLRRLQDQESEVRHWLGELVDHEDQPCRWDHNKNCQEHGTFSWDGKCAVAEAREALGYGGQE